jgi:energy-coupling factor transport system ATP-binding protein
LRHGCILHPVYDSGETVLVVEDLTVGYPGREAPAFEGVNFNLPAGAVLLVCGESGSGKTTLALALSGLLQYSCPEAKISGTVLWNDFPLDWQENPSVAVTLENPYAQLTGIKGTVREEIAFGLEMRGVPPEAMRPRIERAAVAIGIDHLLDRHPMTLSGGEMQRVVIASSHVLAPRLWVLDRPLTELDPIGRAAFLHEMALMARRDGVTIIIAEERAPDVESVAGFILELRDGTAVLQSNEDGFGVLMENAGESAPDAGVKLTKFRALPEMEGTLEESQLVDAQNIDFGYTPDGPLVIRDASIALAPGEMLFITGRNGSGKTTLAKIIAGILRPARGKIFTRGAEITGKPLWEIARHVAFSFQNPDHQIFSKRVWDEVIFGPRNLGYSAQECERLAHRALDYFDLKEKKDCHPYELTRSDRKRLGLASTFAMNTPVLILDEPTQFQNQSVKHRIMSAVRDSLLDGKAVLLITHDPGLLAEWPMTPQSTLTQKLTW